MAMRKYGRENFSFQILEECPEEQLAEREIYWIEKLNTYKEGYNETRGGDLPSEKSIHLGEEHGMAKLKEKDVIQCRKWYAEGKASREIWETYYKDIITYNGFQRMWHGQTWKHIMPEVFKNNPRPRKKFSEEQIQQIKEMYNEKHMTCAQIYHFFEEKISRTTINDICNNRK
jgi:transposase